MSRDELSALQSQRLVKLVERIYENVPYYKAKMDAIGLLPGDIKSIEDLPKLPYTYKQDLGIHILTACLPLLLTMLSAFTHQAEQRGNRLL